MPPKAKYNKVAVPMEEEPLKKKCKYDHNENTNQTIKFKGRNIIINDNKLQGSKTNKSKFFELYEIGDLIAEGGNGAVFKGKPLAVSNCF